MGTQKRGESFVLHQEAAAPDKPIEFMTFVLGLASTAFIHLGDTPHPETGKVFADLLLARQSLEMLSLLRAKTQGNLTPDEERAFDNVLADLRLRFVQASRPPSKI